MYCCPYCFSSPYLIQIIKSNSTKNGQCDFSSHDGVELYDPRELSPFFIGIADLYIPYTSPTTETSPIHDQIFKDFSGKILSRSGNEDRLLRAILEDEIQDYNHLFTNPVAIRCLHDPSSVEQAKILEVSWENFVAEIKTKNRFHIENTVDLDKLERILKRHSRTIYKGKLFFRGRISDQIGYPAGEMGNPPSSMASSGRANPEGISYLYLSDELKTTLYETRASLFDYVSIGEFKLKSNIKTINLRESYIYDPIPLAEKEELEDFLIHQPFISKLEHELSRPIRRNDNKLDYLPTQYLSEFIKSLGFDAIEYRSSLHPEGFNLAVFNPQKFRCIKTYVHEISKIDFEHNLTK